jgi:hypothetical protein
VATDEANREAAPSGLLHEASQPIPLIQFITKLVSRLGGGTGISAPSLRSSTWHLGDQPKFCPIEPGFDEMKVFVAYYPGVYTYDNLDWFAHSWFPKFNATFPVRERRRL